MIIKTLAVGPIMANCFIVGCENTKSAVVIDPGDEADKILIALAESRLTVKYIINTHGHFDHVGANKRMKEATGADILIHKADAGMLEQISTASMAFGLSRWKTLRRRTGPLMREMKSASAISRLK